MVRPRVWPRIDIELDQEDADWMNKGNTVHKQVNKQKYAIYIKSLTAKERKIKELEAQLRALRGQEERLSHRVPTVKKAYVKRNLAYWAEKSRQMKEDSPLFRKVTQ